MAKSYKYVDGKRVDLEAVETPANGIGFSFGDLAAYARGEDEDEEGAGAGDEPAEDEDEAEPEEEEPGAPRPIAARVVGAAAAASNPLAARLARLPTPGGLFPLLFALLALVFAAVPAGPNGETRLQLMWLALTGGARLPYTAAALARQQADAQAMQDNAAVSSTIAAVGEVQAVAGTVWNDFWTVTGDAFHALGG